MVTNILRYIMNSSLADLLLSTMDALIVLVITDYVNIH